LQKNKKVKNVKKRGKNNKRKQRFYIYVTDVCVGFFFKLIYGHAFVRRLYCILGNLLRL